MATLKVVLDTNVIVSGLAYPAGPPGKIVQAWRNGSLQVVLSHFIFDELRRVLPRLANRHGLSAQEVEDLADILMFHSELVSPVDVLEPSLRDRLDLPIIGTFLALETEPPVYLITGDNDLLALAEHYPVISPSAFWLKHGG
jgi:putative PIN family toxin of toxin-antitoxin system